MSDEQKAAYRVNEKGEKSKEMLGLSGKFSELDRVSGLHLPNRRLPSEQREPQAPGCEHTGLTRIGYYGWIGQGPSSGFFDRPPATLGQIHF